MESAQIADLSLTAKSATGEPRENFNALFENFPLNIPGGNKVVSEKMIDINRYRRIGDIELGRVDIEIENLLGFEAMVGARSNRMRQTRNLFEENEINIKDLKTDLEDANIAEVVTRLSQMEMVLESSLNVGARVLTPSLIEFLR
jgi:flagellin-like hook-associated protein FlgL